MDSPPSISTSNKGSNLRQYMKTKYCQHLAQVAGERQRQIASRQKIATALHNVEKQAKAALHPKTVQIRDVDVVSSVTVERPPLSPLSEVTNWIRRQPGEKDSNSLNDSTNRASITGKKQDEHSTHLITKQPTHLKSNIDDMASALDTDKENTTIHTDPSTTQKPALSPRRQWELEPLQNALKRLADTDKLLFLIRPPNTDGFRTTRRDCQEETHRNINYEGVIGTMSRNSVKQRGVAHSALDLLVKHYKPKELQTVDETCQEDAIGMKDIGLEATSEPKSTPVESTQNDRVSTTSTTPTQNTANKVYTLQEDDNGATWIIGTMEAEDATIEGSIQPESNRRPHEIQLEAKNVAISHQSNAESESDEYEDSFYSEN